MPFGLFAAAEHPRHGNWSLSCESTPRGDFLRRNPWTTGSPEDCVRQVDELNGQVARHVTPQFKGRGKHEAAARAGQRGAGPYHPI